MRYSVLIMKILEMSATYTSDDLTLNLFSAAMEVLSNKKED